MYNKLKIFNYYLIMEIVIYFIEVNFLNLLFKNLTYASNYYNHHNNLKNFAIYDHIFMNLMI